MKKLAFMLFLVSLQAVSANKSLQYPAASQIDGKQVADQIHFVNKYYYLSPMPLENQLQGINVVVKKSASGKVYTEVIERYLNNTYQDGIYDSKEMAMIRYGKNRGAAILITDFADESKSRMYQAWIPSLRKVRRIPEADQNDQWMGTQLTFADAMLRQPELEQSELVNTKVFNQCLETIQVDPSAYNKWFKAIYPVNCDVKDKMVYVLKTFSPKETSYDYRVTYVDTETFADYRTDYFKNGIKVKRIDKDWKSMQMPDPRVMYWSYWYVKNYETGSETYIQMSRDNMKYAKHAREEKFWSESTLRKMKR